MFFLFSWVHWFCSRILKPWSDFSGDEILSYFNVQQRGDVIFIETSKSLVDMILVHQLQTWSVYE